MKHRIEYCAYHCGVDEGDQDWYPCTAESGVDYSDRAAVEEEARMLAALTDGHYLYRVVEVDAELERPLPRKTTVQRFDLRRGVWFSVELEIAS